MASVHLDPTTIEWTSGVPFFGQGARHEGRDVIQLKILSDRRNDGGGISWLAKYSPPPGKLLRIIAVAESDEHAFILDGGRATKSGQMRKAANGFSVNSKGQWHSSMIATETVALVVYSGEPDAVESVAVVDLQDAH